MAYTKLGRIRPVYSGEWNSGRGYTALEMVRTSDGGLSYIAQKDVPAGTPLTNGEYWAVVLDVREVLDAAENAADRINNVMDVKANALAATVEGNPVQFSPDGGSVIKPVLTFDPVQAGSGDPSPTNIRPIAGRTGTELVRCGKNLFDSKLIPNAANNGVTFMQNAVDGINVKGTATAYANTYVDIVGSLPVGTYTISANVFDGCQVYIRQMFADGTNITTFAGNSFTLTGSETVLSVFVQVVPGTSHDRTVYIQIEKGSASTYEPYHGSTYTLDFGQTVYGGTLDWNKGEMVVDTGYTELDGREAWTQTAKANGYRYSVTISNAKPTEDFNVISGAISNAFKEITWSQLVNSNVDGFAMHNTTGALGITASQFDEMTLDEFKEWLAQNPVQIAYKLATPIIIPLTPQQITALAGLNTVYSDADGMTVGYNKDLTKAFEDVNSTIGSIVLTVDADGNATIQGGTYERSSRN